MLNKHYKANLFKVSFFLLTSLVVACSSNGLNQIAEKGYADVSIVSAMKKVMWSGELQGKVLLDTISNKNGLQGIGPESYLTGELLILDGKSYVSKVSSDSTMLVKETFEASAPFFVYTHVNEWERIKVPDDIKSMQELEKFVDERTKLAKRPFAFKVSGIVKKATVHIQNLPAGTRVSSPEEAHQGQVNYSLKNEDVEILGFFSTEHKTVFTHHDTFMHLHLITKDRKKMGHLDSAVFDSMTLYLPIH
jgi:acetolactate decarboxylase